LYLTFSELVKRGIDAVARKSALAGESRRVFQQSGGDPIPHVGEVVERSQERLREWRVKIDEDRPHARHARERTLEANEVARSGGSERRPGDEPLEILHGLDRVTELGAFGCPERQLLDRVQPVVYRLERHERTKEPRTQQPAAGRCDCPVNLVEERPLAPSARALHDLEVLEGRLIDEQGVRPLAKGHRSNVRKVNFLCGAQMVEEGSGGRDGRVVPLEAESIKALRAKLVDQGPAGSFDIESPRFDCSGR